jgi:hypothetical protein
MAIERYRRRQLLPGHHRARDAAQTVRPLNVDLLFAHGDRERQQGAVQDVDSVPMPRPVASVSGHPHIHSNAGHSSLRSTQADSRSRNRRRSSRFRRGRERTVRHPGPVHVQRSLNRQHSVDPGLGRPAITPPNNPRENPHGINSIPFSQTWVVFHVRRRAEGIGRHLGRKTFNYLVNNARIGIYAPSPQPGSRDHRLMRTRDRLYNAKRAPRCVK